METMRDDNGFLDELSRQNNELVNLHRDLAKKNAELRRTEAELAEQRQQLFHMERVLMMGEMASQLAHEICQPLAGILSNAQAAQQYIDRNVPDLNLIREILADIVSDDKRAGEIIAQMRNMLRMVPPLHEPFCINDAIQEVTRLSHAGCHSHAVSLRLDLAKDLPRMVGDRIQLQQVVLNLILNAEQAIQEKQVAEDDATIVVSTELESSGQIRVSVQDSGPGIPAVALDRIFTPFYTTKPNGLGMGLAICRSIVTAHGGRIRAENSPARGARVSFTVPVESAQ